MKSQEARIAGAKYDAERARKSLVSTMGALQYRLRPGNLMSDALDGARDKGSSLADEAVTLVKEQPVAASGVAAGIMLYLARRPIIAALKGKKRRKEPAHPVASVASADVAVID